MDLGEFYGNIRLIFSGSLKYSTFDKGRREAAIEWKLFGIFIKYPQQCTFQNNMALATNIHIICHQQICFSFSFLIDGRPSPNCCACWNMSVFTFKLLMLLNSIELSQTSIRSEWLLRNCQINFVEIFSSTFIKKSLWVLWNIPPRSPHPRPFIPLQKSCLRLLFFSISWLICHKTSRCWHICVKLGPNRKALKDCWIYVG